MSALRAGAVLAGFALLTLPLMPVQAVLKRVHTPSARRFPHWYHRQVCRLMGVKLNITGSVDKSAPVLLVSNHTSWLDIPVISAVAPVSFIAKKEVGGWPGVSALARLQRTVFVDRERRTAVGATTNELVARLASGDTLVLFAEGTSSDGNRILPFRSSLFAAAKPSRAALAARDAPPKVLVQTMAIAYTHLHGLPLGRADRPVVGWYGDMEMLGHAWQLLKAGPLDVEIRISEPVPLDTFKDRKELATHAEKSLRGEFVRLMRRRPDAIPAPPAISGPQEKKTLSPELNAPQKADGNEAKPKRWV